MKNIYKKSKEKSPIISVFFILSLLLFSCAEEDQIETEKLEFVYTHSIELEDYETAIHIIHEQLYYDSNNINLYDTLVQLYHKDGNDKSTLATLDYLFDYVTDERNLIIGVESALRTNNTEKTISYMEALSSSYSDSLVWTYKLGVVHFNLKNDNESLEKFNTVISNNQSKLENVDVNVDGKDLSIPIYSASKNTMGIIYSRNNYIEEAKACFKEALRFSPEFYVAEENLLAIEGK